MEATLNQERPDLDARETVRWAYRLLLGREVESEATVDAHLAYQGGGKLNAVRLRLMASPEFRGCLSQIGVGDGLPGADSPFLERTEEGLDGFFLDRFGVRTRLSSLAPSYHIYSGKVGSPDGAFDMPIHEPDELNALLRSIAEARQAFVIVELGAGWGPFIVLGGHLARQRGLLVSMMGVEGSLAHVAFIETHLVDNGFSPEEHHIIHAVAGARDGVARFPTLGYPSMEWGQGADFDLDQVAGDGMEEVPSLSLTTLLDRLSIVDFLHCDVQGAEVDVFRAAIEVVNQQVRRVCIGTHSRLIELELFDLLAKHGWVLEAEQPCRIIQEGDIISTLGDGVQIWRNSRTLPASHDAFDQDGVQLLTRPTREANQRG